jgi:2-oxoglutarate ferredoxin oxidoreductase subunit beta
MVYGLTKGQASPTSQLGYQTPVQPKGVSAEPFNPLALAISLDASFVARVFIGDPEPTREIIKQAIEHKGYSLVDIFQPCVSFNKVNTYQWFKEHTYYLEAAHNSSDRIEAFRRAVERDPLPLGIFYKNPNKATFEENLEVYVKEKTPVSRRPMSRRAGLERIIQEKRS